MMKVHHHLHANHIGDDSTNDKPPPSLLALQQEHRFKLKPYEIIGADGRRPLWIATKKLLKSSAAEATFFKAHQLLVQDPSFSGYIENELVSSDRIHRFKGAVREYDMSMSFPVANPVLVSAERGADLHVFVPHTPKGAALDGALSRRLEEAGFYVVTSDTESIWTLLLQNPNDAKALFDVLKEYFALAGGVSKIETEEIVLLKSGSEDYRLRPVVPSGSRLLRS